MTVGAALLMMMATASGCTPALPADMVARSGAFGSAIAPTIADADAAVVAGSIARRAARRYLGLDLPRFLIDASGRPGETTTGGCDFVFRWSFARPGAGERLPSHVLPHEIGHAVFIRFLVPRTDSGQYGGAAPDWLDEMAALAFEDEAGARLRRADTWRHAERDALIPLARLLVMTHPEWRAPSGDSQSAPSGTAPPGSTETPAFYATVRALFDFLIARTDNPRVIRVLAEHVRAGAPIDRWLLRHVAGRQARAGLAGLDASLRAFVLHDPGYRDGAQP